MSGVNPRDEAAAPAAEAELVTVTQRVAKMQNKLLQDTSRIVEELTAGFDKLHTTFAMLAKNVALSQVKMDEGNVETRRIFAQGLEGLAERLAGEISDRVVERVILTAVADAVDAADLVLKGVREAERGTPVVEALRMVRSKLLAGFRPFGVELIAVEPGTTRFDDTLHECASVDATSDVADGVVTDVYAHGYTLRGRAIRRAKVVVKGAAR